MPPITCTPSMSRPIMLARGLDDADGADRRTRRRLARSAQRLGDVASGADHQRARRIRRLAAEDGGEIAGGAPARPQAHDHQQRQPDRELQVDRWRSDSPPASWRGSGSAATSGASGRRPGRCARRRAAMCGARPGGERRAATSRKPQRRRRRWRRRIPARSAQPPPANMIDDVRREIHRDHAGRRRRRRSTCALASIAARRAETSTLLTHSPPGPQARPARAPTARGLAPETRPPPDQLLPESRAAAIFCAASPPQ